LGRCARSTPMRGAPFARWGITATLSTHRPPETPVAPGSLAVFHTNPLNVMANFIELSNALGPRAINIDHIQTFTSVGQGTRITFRGNSGQEDVRENYEVVRAMLSVTSAPQPPIAETLDPTEELVTA
jgi:hypothetical protein